MSLLAFVESVDILAGVNDFIFFSKGWVTELGAICPLFILTSGCKGVNNERIWIFSENLTALKSCNLDSFCN